MKVELTILERLILSSILPGEGDFTTLKVLRKLKEDLSFSEEEHLTLRFETKDNGSVSWQPEGNIPKEVPIGEKAKDIIVDALKKLNADKKLTNDHFSLYEKFVTD
jgi:hypothetical protein